MELRLVQLESWNKCLKKANAAYKVAETKYRRARLTIELSYDGIIKSNNKKYMYSEYYHAKNMLMLAINHQKWAEDGLNEFMDQRPVL